MSTELLPCPFCAGKAAVKRHAGFPSTNPRFGVSCYRCGLWLDCREATEAEAANVWNTRAAAPPASIRERTPEERAADKANMRAVHLSGLPAAQRQEQEGPSHG